MEMVTEQEAYENLCNAIVVRAVNDVANGMVYHYFNDVYPNSYHSALRFLKDESRLTMFTNADSDWLIAQAEKKAEYLVEQRLNNLLKEGGKNE